MTSTYDGMFVARGIPQDIQALRQDASLFAELDPAAGKEAVIGNYSVLVFRGQHLGRHALEGIARRIAKMHRRIEVAVALWQPNGMGIGVGFRGGLEWHRFETNSPEKLPAMPTRAWNSFRNTALARLAARRAEWFTNLLSAGKLAWVMGAA
jgi:hypothetical protein